MCDRRKHGSDSEGKITATRSRSGLVTNRQCAECLFETHHHPQTSSNKSVFRMESEAFYDAYVEVKVEATKNLLERPDSPEECMRPETPSSNASTSGVCSMASSDFESSEENAEEKPESQHITLDCPVIIYQKRNILDVFQNIYPFSIYQTTNVPKMDMTNYWERRSIYHRLGPFGNLDELDFKKCFFCDFHSTVPKRMS